MADDLYYRTMNNHKPAIHDQLLILRRQNGAEVSLRISVNHCCDKLLCHAKFLTEHEESAHDVTQESWLAIVKDREVRCMAPHRAWRASQR